VSKGSKDRQFEVVAFFDPYDTDTITRRTVGDRFAEGTLLEWLKGGQELQLLGCPNWYMKKFFDSISRRVAISHSLRSIYVKPETRKANMQNAGNPIDELIRTTNKSPAKATSKSPGEQPG